MTCSTGGDGLSRCCARSAKTQSCQSCVVDVCDARPEELLSRSHLEQSMFGGAGDAEFAIPNGGRLGMS